MTRVQTLTSSLQSEGSELGRTICQLSEELANHPLYHSLTNLNAVRTYMEYQVWCVWDFMSLLKAIQVAVTCLSVPWVPPPEPLLVAYVNGIVSSEEADETPEGGRASHFESYLSAMREAGASTRAIETFIDSLCQGSDVESALSSCGAPVASQAFVHETLSLASGPLPDRIAAFCIGREEVIPNMFVTLLSSERASMQDIPILSDPRLNRFRWYLERHVKLDTESHGPLSARIFHLVVKDDPVARSSALKAGLRALEARKALLDAALSDITEKQTL
jgi:hypothetical protein